MARKSDKIKESDQGIEDRISVLPDSILSHILSFLPTKYAVATSILSKRWKLVWTSLSNLCFDDRLCSEYERTGYLTNDAFTTFENFVNRVLVLSHPVNINKFSLHFVKLRYFACLNFWISTAIMRNVRELELSVEGSWWFTTLELPESICTCKTLEVLKLKLNLDVVIKIPPSGMCFPSVKIIHVDVYDLEYNLSEVFCSNCPALEDLSIMGYLYGELATFNISSPTLKKLTLEFKHTDELSDTEHRVVIMAPNLELLYIIDCPPVSYTVHEPHCLPKLVVDFYIGRYMDFDLGAQCLVQLLKDITNAKFLSLTYCSLCVLKHTGVDFFPTLPNLTCLELECTYYGWRLLLIILSRSPNLESLIIGKDIGGECEWTEMKFVPDCLLSHVKTIEIRGFEGQKNELILIKYLLKNSEVLNTLIIKFQNVALNLKDNVYQKLLMFERGSKSCKVKVL